MLVCVTAVARSHVVNIIGALKSCIFRKLTAFPSIPTHTRVRVPRAIEDGAPDQEVRCSGTSGLNSPGDTCSAFSGFTNSVRLLRPVFRKVTRLAMTPR